MFSQYRNTKAISYYSQLSFNGHLYKTDTSLRRAATLVLAISLLFSFSRIPSKTDTSLKQTTDTLKQSTDSSEVCFYWEKYLKV